MSRCPLVSAIIPFLNAGKFIQETIESVFSQTYDNWELFLVDDGSIDAGTAIAMRYERRHPGKVHYLYHDGHRNRGPSASRNLGIRNAKGEYIAFLDADDVWLPGHMAGQVAVLDSQPKAAMVYGQTLRWYSWTGNPEDKQRDCIYDLGVQLDTLIMPPRLVTEFLRNEDTVASTCSVLVRREAAERVGGFEEAVRDIYADMVFYTKVFLESPVFVASGCIVGTGNTRRTVVRLRSRLDNGIQLNPARCAAIF